MSNIPPILGSSTGHCCRAVAGRRRPCFRPVARRPGRAARAPSAGDFAASLPRPWGGCPLRPARPCSCPRRPWRGRSRRPGSQERRASPPRLPGLERAEGQPAAPVFQGFAPCPLGPSPPSPLSPLLRPLPVRPRSACPPRARRGGLAGVLRNGHRHSKLGTSP